MANIWSYEKTCAWLSSKDTETLSECQYTFLVKQFISDDTDGDLHISMEELSEVLESIADDCSFGEARCAEILRDFDLDHNGTIEFHEFCLLVLSHADFICIRKALTAIEFEHNRYVMKKMNREVRSCIKGRDKAPSVQGTANTSCRSSRMSSAKSETSDASNFIPKTPFQSTASRLESIDFGHINSSEFLLGIVPDNDPDSIIDRDDFTPGETAIASETLQLRRSSEHLGRARNSQTSDLGTVSILRNSTASDAFIVRPSPRNSEADPSP